MSAAKLPSSVSQPAFADLVIVGGGMVAERLLCRLEALNYAGTVELISEESEAGYNRVLLPDLLAGRSNWSDMASRSNTGARGAWYKTRLGNPVVDLDLTSRQVTDANGVSTRWSTLVLAMGSSAAIPSALRLNSAGIQAFRSLTDVKKLEAISGLEQTVAVVGGGLLGLEAAHALCLRGFRVVVVHRSAMLMNRQLCRDSADLLHRMLLKQGLEFRLETEVVSVDATAERVHSLSLSDGSVLAVDRILVATGNDPNIALAQKSGIRCRKGIVVDDHLQSSEEGVYAIGECAEFSGDTHCFVEPVYAQADALARALCGEATNLVLPPASARLKVAGIELFCAGCTPADRNKIVNPDLTTSVVRDTRAGVYRSLTFDTQKLTGAILLGDTSGSRHIFGALNTPVNSALEREQLLFGTVPSYA